MAHKKSTIYDATGVFQRKANSGGQMTAGTALFSEPGYIPLPPAEVERLATDPRIQSALDMLFDMLRAQPGDSGLKG